MMTALSCKKTLVQVWMGRVVGFQSFASFVKSLMLGNYITGQKNCTIDKLSPPISPLLEPAISTFALVTDIPFHPFLLTTEAVLPDVHFSQKSSAIIPSVKRSFSPSKLNVTYNLHSP
jgi:hypothetical protein